MSYISLDLDKCLIRHKHPSMTTVANLVEIEAADSSISIFHVDGAYRELAELGGFELAKIYEMTLSTKPRISGQALINALCQVVKFLPETDCKSFETETQAAYFYNQPHKGYMYVKGATRPALISECGQNAYLNLWLRSTEAQILEEMKKPRPMVQHAPAVSVAKPSANPWAK